MLPTTFDALNAVMKADPVLTLADRARIVALIRNYRKEAAPARPAAAVERSNAVLVVPELQEGAAWYRRDSR